MGFGKSPVYTVYMGTEESKECSINQSHRSLSFCLHAVVRAFFIFLRSSLHAVLPVLVGMPCMHPCKTHKSSHLCGEKSAHECCCSRGSY